MKFIVEKNSFQSSLAKIQGIAERRSTIPVLSNILISEESNKISIVATDLEIGVKEITEANILEKGNLCIAARKLYDVVRELPEDRVEVEKAQNFWASVKAGKTVFNLPGLDPNEFPKFPTNGGEHFFTAPVSELLSMIEKTVFAASTDDTRFNLNGVYMENVKAEGREVLRMVATDGHRLAMIDKEIKATLEKGLTIPRRGLMELRKILDDSGKEVRVALKENNCIFGTERNTVVVRLLEGDYPDYQQVIPTSNDKQVVIDRKEFIGSLRRAHVIASEKGEGVKFLIKSGTMEIKTGGPDVGDFQEEIGIEYKGDSVDMSFNARYLLDVLNIIDTKNIQIEVKDEMSPGLVKPVNGEGYLYVIMPMRL